MSLDRYHCPDFRESQLITLRVLKLINRLYKKTNRKQRDRLITEISYYKGKAEHHKLTDAIINWAINWKNRRDQVNS